jgi:hypothetical protein
VAERSQSATFVVGNIKKNPKQSTRLGLPLSCCLDQASEQGDRNCRGACCRPAGLLGFGRPHRALGIVLLCHRVAEQRHQQVAELRDDLVA